MRLYRHGTILRVTLSADDVAALRDRWPCSGLRYGDRLSVWLDGRNGDLVDYYFNGRSPAPARVDESALRALTEDANNYAAAELARPELARPAGGAA
jgi:hypothetical protein